MHKIITILTLTCGLLVAGNGAQAPNFCYKPGEPKNVVTATATEVPTRKECPIHQGDPGD
jgi:hypothetical protein